MRKRGAFSIFFIIFLLVLMPNVYSIYGELIYSGTVEDKDIINVSGRSFEFKIDSVSRKVYIKIDTSGIIIPAGDCEIKDGWDICASNVTLSYRNYTAWYDVYKTNVNIYQLKSTLDAISSIEKNNLLIGEETIAELTLENAADIAAENVAAAVNIPSNLLVTSVEGCKNAITRVIFDADVYPKQVRKCTYKLQGLGGGDFKLKANVTYFNGIEEKTVTSNTISGKVYNYSLEISSKLNKIRFDINEKINFTVNIKNTNGDYDLTITNFNIKLPENILLVKKPKDAVANDRIISWSGTLAPNEDKEFTAQLQVSVSGNYSIVSEANYKLSKFSRTEKNTLNLEIYCDCPYVTHEFFNKITIPGQKEDLKALIINPSSVNYFSNVKVDYVTNIPYLQDFSTAYSQINPLETIKLFDSPVTIPNLSEFYYFNITAVYKSSGNQLFVTRDNLVIEPSKKKKEPAEEIIIEEQQETKETMLGQEETEEKTNLTEKEIIQEIPVTALEDGKKSPIKSYTVIAFIMILIGLLVIFILLKRGKDDEQKHLNNPNSQQIQK
ncbi:MAG: hypothetical protein V1831_03485 [Candidatus Woesearchaeota archaeon]